MNEETAASRGGRVPDLPAQAATVWETVAQRSGPVELRRFEPGRQLADLHPRVRQAAKALNATTDAGTVGPSLWVCYLGDRGRGDVPVGYGEDPEAAAHAALKDAERRRGGGQTS